MPRDRHHRWNLCGKDFPTEKDLEEHVERRHPTEDIHWWVVAENPMTTPPKVSPGSGRLSGRPIVGFLANAGDWTVRRPRNMVVDLPWNVRYDPPLASPPEDGLMVIGGLHDCPAPPRGPAANAMGVSATVTGPAVRGMPNRDGRV